MNQLSFRARAHIVGQVVDLPCHTPHGRSRLCPTSSTREPATALTRSTLSPAVFLRSLVVSSALFVLLCSSAIAAPPTTRPVEGLRDNTPEVTALVGARIVISPGQEIDSGIVVLRGERIESVGADVAIPADARRIDVSGKTIYAGLIDAFGEAEIGEVDGDAGAPHWNSQIVPQRRMAARYKPDSGRNEKLRRQGVTLRLVAPSGNILKGTSALVTTGETAGERAIVRADVAQHIRLTVSRRGRQAYPGSPMGAVALARQTMLDAAWHRDAWRVFASDGRVPRPESNDALAALEPVVDAGSLVVIDAINELYALRADRFAREFGLNAILRGSGSEYRRLDAIRQTGRAVIVPVNFPKAPHVATPEAAREASLEALMHWDLAPENAAHLHSAGVRIALTSHGLSDPGEFLANVRKAVARGLSPDAALESLTITPAELFGVESLAGTIEPGKLANLVVADGDLFDDKTKVLETWTLGRRNELAPPPLFDLRGRWTTKLEPPATSGVALIVELTGEPDKLTGTVQAAKPKKGDEPIKLQHVGLNDARFAAVFDSDRWGRPGAAQLSVVVARNENGALAWLGRVEWPDGATSACSADHSPAAPDTTSNTDNDDTEKDKDDAGAASGENDEKPSGKEVAPKSFDPTPLVYPLGAFGVASPGETPMPRRIWFKNATVWTCGPAGVLHGASVLVVDGKIVAVGGADTVDAGSLESGDSDDATDGTLVIDLDGKHLTPGIIDCHSHMATDGGINEATQAITAEVRIGDFIDSDDINIYRQLAGGVTCVNILHGSANPIGGQNQVIKLRWGDLPEAMKFAAAPAGIKFALGENVKQSNWGESFNSRYPQSRMGVEQIIDDAFEAAAEYSRRLKQWDEKHEGLPPRRDLELEAIAEIVEGRRWIHCHSYRQDEILALLRTAEKRRITIGTLQHILEGYKVADAMARHGAMGSSFSDWWAYKFEVYDAIPYNGALMHQAGVVVSFNSDDQELARHLNHEAAKAVKYGGVPPEEALKFVTLNPAKQLRIDRFVGSIEVGKDADIVVWSAPPLSTMSRCEQTWVDGRRRFDRTDDLELRRRDRELHLRLVQKALAGKAAMLKPGESNPTEEELWPRHDEYCHAHPHDDDAHHNHEHRDAAP